MLYDVSIQLTRPMLGDQATQERIFRFTRGRVSPGEEGVFVFELASDFWAWLVREAVDALHLEGVLDVSAIRVPMAMEAPRVTTYRHHYRNKFGTQKVDSFECVSENVKLSFELLLTRPIDEDSGLRAPTAEELKTILEFIGKYLGISPWGSKFNFGRFDLLELKCR